MSFFYCKRQFILTDRSAYDIFILTDRSIKAKGGATLAFTDL